MCHCNWYSIYWMFDWHTCSTIIWIVFIESVFRFMIYIIELLLSCCWSFSFSFSFVFMRMNRFRINCCSIERFQCKPAKKREKKNEINMQSARWIFLLSFNRSHFVLYPPIWLLLLNRSTLQTRRHKERRVSIAE